MCTQYRQLIYLPFNWLNQNKSEKRGYENRDCAVCLFAKSESQMQVSFPSCLLIMESILLTKNDIPSRNFEFLIS